MAFKSGKNGRFKFGSVEYKIKRWTANPRNQLQDVTNGETSGYGQYIAGVSDLDGTVELDHDVGSSPFVAGIVPGSEIVALLYIDGIAAPVWSINAIIEDMTETLDVRGLASLVYRWRATYATTGSVPGVGWTPPST